MQNELSLAHPAFRVIEAVVGNPRQECVSEIGGTPEHLDAVILLVMDLDIVDFGLVTDTVEGDTVELVLG